MLIHYSKTESETLGLKIGRCNNDFFDSQQLKEEIAQNNYDLCRVKVSAEDEFVLQRLDEIGFPYYFSGSIRRYKTPIHQSSLKSFLHKDLEFIAFQNNNEHHDLLFSMLKDTWGDYPIGYYRTPLLDNFCNKENELQSVFEFYKTNNNTLLNPLNSIQFIKHEGKYVGFFVLNIVNGHLESHIGGILKAFQSKGYFYDMLAYIRNFCVNHSLSHFVFGARNENAKVQKIFQSEGFIPIGSENVFHVVPLFQKVLHEGSIRKFEMSTIRKAHKILHFYKPIENQIDNNYLYFPLKNKVLCYQFNDNNLCVDAWILN
jgi:hypothetical protein